jgi:H+/Cl- antiporter ClcA
MSALFATIAALLTVYLGPGAAGSGVAEVMGMVNGVNYHDHIGFKTLFVKIIGVCLGVAGGLCIGKEGPLAHIGANVGVLLLYLPFPYNVYLRNDVEKRKFIVGGVAAGVSAAFGAPIGGTLFAYEISKPNSFWTFSLTWRVFFTSSISTFTLNLWKTIYAGTWTISNSGVIKFGNNSDASSSLADIPASIIIGLVCGLLGAGFVAVN